MLDADRLGSAGRTGRIEHVSEIVGARGNRLGHFSFGGLRLGVEQQPGAAVCKDGRKRGVGQNDRRGRVRDNETYPFSRIRGIKGQIGPSGLVNGKNRDDQTGRARQRDANDDAGPDTKSREPPRQARRLLMECGKTSVVARRISGRWRSVFVRPERRRAWQALLPLAMRRSRQQRNPKLVPVLPPA